MFTRALPITMLALASFGATYAQSARADTLDSAHNTLCMRLQQCASQAAADPDADSGVLQLFNDGRQGLCSSPLAQFGGKPADARGRELARACYRSVTVQGCGELIGMDMSTQACMDFQQYLHNQQ
ncbi:MAG: hypothetical protein AAF499_05365 [Pseudomonadota bacterium]